MTEAAGDIASYSFEKAVADYRALFDARTQVIAHDLHPGYRATLVAGAMAAENSETVALNRK